MNKFQKVLKWLVRFVTLFIPCIVQGVVRMKNDKRDSQVQSDLTNINGKTDDDSEN